MKKCFIFSILNVNLHLSRNSIDAKSTIIQINLVGTGIEKITIKDNGIGMSK